MISRQLLTITRTSIGDYEFNTVMNSFSLTANIDKSFQLNKSTLYSLGSFRIFNIGRGLDAHLCLAIHVLFFSLGCFCQSFNITFRKFQGLLYISFNHIFSVSGRALSEAIQRLGGTSYKLMKFRHVCILRMWKKQNMKTFKNHNNC